MDLDSVLLGLLRKPATGYDIKQAFAQVLGHFWDAELSQIYRTLQRLEAQGQLRSREASSDKGPARRVYEITRAGRIRLHTLLHEPPRRARQRFPNVAQLHFMGELADLDATAVFIRQLRDGYLAALRPLQDIEKQWRQADERYPHRLPDDAFHAHLTLTMGVARLQALAQWCEGTLQTIDARRRAGGSS